MLGGLDSTHLDCHMCQSPSPYTRTRAKKKTTASAMPLTLYQFDCLLPDKTMKDLQSCKLSEKLDLLEMRLSVMRPHPGISSNRVGPIHIHYLTSCRNRMLGWRQYAGHVLTYDSMSPEVEEDRRCLPKHQPGEGQGQQGIVYAVDGQHGKAHMVQK